MLLLAFEEDIVSLALVQVVSCITKHKKEVIKMGKTGCSKGRRKRAAVIIVEEGINRLSSLRLNGFRGGVIVLTKTVISDLMSQNKILSWGRGSHDSIDSRANIKDIVYRINTIVPLEEENWQALKSQLTKYISRVVLPILRNLQREHRLPVDDLRKLREAIIELRARDKMGAHRTIEFDGEKKQLQNHVMSYFERIREAQTRSTRLDAINKLKEVIIYWHDNCYIL